jgi:hypothetical protein
MKLFCLLTLALTTAYAQTAINAPGYRVEKADAPPASLAPSVSGLLAKTGFRIVTSAGKPALEIWLRAEAPKGPATTEEAVTFTNVPQGTLIAAVNFPEKWADRRGQTIAPGLYTMRYSQFPITGDHQGVAPQRDFFLVVPAKDDTNGAATPGFRELVAMSLKATGTPHPGVFSSWKPEEGEFKAGFHKDGDHDWVFSEKLGDLPMSVILVGQADH